MKVSMYDVVVRSSMGVVSRLTSFNRAELETEIADMESRGFRIESALAEKKIDVSPRDVNHVVWRGIHCNVLN